MKPHAILLILVLLLFGASRAPGQGFRGSMGTAPGSGNRGQAGVATSSSFHGARVPQYRSTSGLSQQSQHFQSSGSRAPVVIQIPNSPGPGRGATGFALTPPTRGVAPEVLEGGGFQIHPHAHPHLHHHRHFRRHPHFRRHGGILIIEVPRVVGTGVITRLVPSGGWVDPLVLENRPADARTRAPGQLAPFDPTPQEVVERMLALAGVRPGDVLYDLGSGDGRVVVAAAKRYGVQAVGFEIDSGLVKLGRENVRKEKLEKLVEIRQQDFLTADLSPASVVTLYLSYDGNLAVRPQLMKQLKPGARVVSYAFDMGEWQPKIAEAYRDAAGDTHMLYLWQIGEPVVFSNLNRASAE